MKNYEKPVVLENEEVAEGVYLASGDGIGGKSGGLVPSDCYTVTWNIHQKPEVGRGDFRIQINANHHATDGHHSGKQTLVVAFNQAVDYVSSGGTYVSGSGTSTIAVDYSYHNNSGDNIGLGDLVVTANAGLAIESAGMICNHDCGQH